MHRLIFVVFGNLAGSVDVIFAEAPFGMRQIFLRASIYWENLRLPTLVVVSPNRIDVNADCTELMAIPFLTHSADYKLIVSYHFLRCEKDGTVSIVRQQFYYISTARYDERNKDYSLRSKFLDASQSISGFLTHKQLSTSFLVVSEFSILPRSELSPYILSVTEHVSDDLWVNLSTGLSIRVKLLFLLIVSSNRLYWIY